MGTGSVLPKGPQGAQAVQEGALGQPHLTCAPSLTSRRLGEVDGTREGCGSGLGLARTLDSSAELRRPRAGMVPRCAGGL